MKQRKVGVVGRAGVGKTSLIRSYLGVHDFEETYTPTGTSDFFSKSVTIDGTEISGSIWDIGGKSKMGRSFMRDTHGVILVVDLSKKNKMLDGLDQIYNDVVNLAGFGDDYFPCHVVANKSDSLPEGHDYDDAKALLDSWCLKRRKSPIAYTMVSAKTGSNVEISITSLFTVVKDYEPRIAKSYGSRPSVSNSITPTSVSEPSSVAEEKVEEETQVIPAKVVIAGAAAVGKTSILKRFADEGDALKEDNMKKYDPTIGADFRIVNFPARDRILKMEIWDTSGDRKMMSLGRSIYKNADYIILVYDITSAESFQALDTYYDNFVLYGNAEDPDAFPCLLVGNKCDVGERATKLEDVLAWCAKKRPKRPITHIECSALRSIAVNDIFIIVADAIADYANYLDGEGSDSDDSSAAGYRHRSLGGDGSVGGNTDITPPSSPRNRNRTPVAKQPRRAQKSCVQDVTEQLSLCSMM